MSDPLFAARRRRRGFTLVEMLVVIAVITLVVALLLPAIQSNRCGGGIKISCRNNMKQLGLALQNHADTYKTFPPLMFTIEPGENGDIDAQSAATADRRYSFHVRLLPFMEEDTLYKQLSKSSAKFTIPADDPRVQVTNPTGAGTINPAALKINALICPSFSGETENGGVAGSNYVAIAATTEGKLTPRGAFGADDAKNTQAWNVEPDGMIIPGRLGKGYPMSRMADGTSKTCVLAESREGVQPSDIPATTQNSWYKPSQSYVYAFPPSLHPGANDVGFDGAGKFTPGAKTALNYGPSPQTPQAIYKSSTSPGPSARNFGPGSEHMGGIVIHGMGDGSVQEITDNVDPGAYYSVITVNGGERISPPWSN